MSEGVRLIKPTLPPMKRVEKYFEKSINASWFSNFGPCYNLLCEKIKSRLNVEDVTVVSNATVAIELLLKSVRLNQGTNNKTHILTPSYTFPATTTAIFSTGFLPLFVDVDAEDWHASEIDLEKVANLNSERIAALLLCSTFGTPPSKSKLLKWRQIANTLNVPLFIDSAAGFGATFDSSELESTFSDAVVYSMHATKTFAVGEGGIIAGKLQWIQISKELSNFGFDNQREFSLLGTNAKLSEIHCAFALAALEDLEDHISTRRDIAEHYFQELKFSQDIEFQAGREKATWQSMFIQVKDIDFKSRIKNRLKKANIQYREDWGKPTHRAWNSKNLENHILTNTESLAIGCLTLPIWVEMDKTILNFIISNVLE